MIHLALCVASLTLGMPMFQAKPPFYEDVQAFARADKQNPPAKGQVLFVGSSSFTRWTEVQKAFPTHQILNRAFGGSSLTDVTRYADQVIFAYKPKQIVIYCGENDLAGDPKLPASRVVQRFQKLLTLIRRREPKVPLVYVSMKPSPSRRNLMPKMVAANRRIAALLAKDGNAKFVDVYNLMLDSRGQPQGDLFVEDKLHMNEKGYAIWTKVIEPTLK